MWRSCSPRNTQVGSYSNVRASGGPWCSSESLMSRIRSRMRSMLIRPSARASGPPGQEWAPRPNARCSLAFLRSTLKSAGSSNRRGSRLAAPLSSMTGVPGAMSTPPTLTARRASRKSAFTGLSIRSASSMKSGMRSRWTRSSSCSSGYSERYLSPVARRRAVVSWPAAKRNEAVRTTDATSGSNRPDTWPGRDRSTRRGAGSPDGPRCIW